MKLGMVTTLEKATRLELATWVGDGDEAQGWL